MSKEITLQKNTKSFRMQAEKLGGCSLYAAKAYVASRFNRSAYDEALTVDVSKLRFADEQSIVVAHGEKGRGALLFKARIDSTGKYAMAYDVKRLKESFTSLSLTKTEVFSQAEFVERVTKKADIRSIKRVKGGEEIVGLLFGNVGDTYSALVNVVNGRVTLHDVELSKNEYNATVLCHLGDASKVASKADSLVAALREAAKNAKVAKVRTAKAKKTRSKAVSAQKTVTAAAEVKTS